MSNRPTTAEVNIWLLRENRYVDYHNYNVRPSMEVVTKLEKEYLEDKPNERP